jgi:ABC-2 type transport system ATP-binding protein
LSAVIPGRAPRDPHILVRTDGLTKRYGGRTAVDPLDLEVRRGDVFALLGPNGSGKTTTIGMLLGLVRPTAGRAEIFGLRVPEDLPLILRRIGAIVEIPTFYPHLSGRDNLRAFARVLGVAKVAERVDAALAQVDLAERGGDKFAAYSLGMKQRLGIAAALLNDPELLILDEPTNGLDPAGMVQVRELIRRLGQEGRTVILCSHLLHEVEQVCDHAAILQAGRAIARGPVAELRHGPRGLELQTPDRDRAAEALLRLDWVKGVTPVRLDAGPGLFVQTAPERAYDLSAALAQQGIYLSLLRPRQASLEDVFLDLTDTPSA